MDPVTFQDVADMNAIVVGKYFEGRGLVATRLDDNPGSNLHSACDWLVQSTESSFLCEVKTINSVQRGVTAQAEFRKFENHVKDYIGSKKSIRNLPFHLHFHSNTLSLPGNAVLDRFLKIVTDELSHVNAQGLKLDFPISVYLDEHLSLHIYRSSSERLKVQFSTYGGLNVEVIKNRVSDAVSQLKTLGKDYSSIARIIILTFAGQIYITDNSEVAILDCLPTEGIFLWRCIESLLRKYDTLSAIAVMFGQAAPYFLVHHNPTVKGIEPLNREVFDDGISIQFDSLNAIPRVPIKSCQSRNELATFIFSDIGTSEQKALTLVDYQKMKTQQNQ